jgi:hypothetical protein
MYRAAITALGEERLSEGGLTPLYLALAALASPQLEAAHPRALFDAFCARLGECRGAPQSTDDSRVLWRALCGEGLIAVRGSSQVDAARAFAVTAPALEGSPSRWERTPAAVGAAGQGLVTPAVVPRDPPLIPSRVTDWLHDAVDRIVRSAIGS